MEYIKTGNSKVGGRSAKKYEAKEFYKDKSVVSIIVGAVAYIYTSHEVGILRMLVITLAVVWTLNQLLPFWFDLLLSVIGK